MLYSLISTVFIETCSSAAMNRIMESRDWRPLRSSVHMYKTAQQSDASVKKEVVHSDVLVSWRKSSELDRDYSHSIGHYSLMVCGAPWRLCAVALMCTSPCNLLHAFNGCITAVQHAQQRRLRDVRCFRPTRQVRTSLHEEALCLCSEAH